MIYSAEISTPANTTAVDPLITELSITRGLIYKLLIYGPHGAMGLHYLQIFDGLHQLWPSSRGTAFRGDGFMFEFEDLYLKETPPFRFQIRTWNLDTDYDHLYWVYIGMVSKEAYMLRFLPGLSLEQAKQSLKDLQEQQELEKIRIIKEGLSGTL